MFLLSGFSAGTAAAQDQPQQNLKPVVTIAFSGYDKLHSDVALIAKISDNPNLIQGFESLIDQATGGKGLAGLDKARPWGFVLQTDGQTFPMYGFIPVATLKEFLDSLGPVIGPAEKKDDLYEANIKGQTIYLKEKNGWALIASNQTMLPEKVEDPTTLLAGLNKTYDLSVQAVLKNVPAPLRMMLVSMIQMGAQRGMERGLEETEEQYALRKKLADQAVEQMQTLINDLDTLTVGLAVDEQAKTASLEYQLTAQAGTKTAEQMAGEAIQNTAFAGFLAEGDAVNLNVTSRLSESAAAQASNSLAAARQNALNEVEKQKLDKDELDKAKKMVNELMDVIQATIEKRTIDAALGLKLAPNAATLVAGAQVADAAKLDSLFRQLVEQVIKQQPDAASMIKVEVEKTSGLTFHSATMPVEEIPNADAQVLKQIFGDNIDVAIALGEGKAYVAAGRGAMEALKKAIAGSAANKVVLPMQLVVDLEPIVRFIGSVARQDQVKAMAAKIENLLSQTRGKNDLIVTSQPIPNGKKVRIELQEGVLKVLGSIPRLSGGA
jgi:hypothetical protein